MNERGMKAWGHDSHALLSLDEAWAAIAREVRPLGVESAPLSQAFGRVLAAPIFANEDHPAFDKAMMDGFAVRAADCAAPGARLVVIGLIAAGDAPTPKIGPGQALRINTGAPVPTGADAVVRVEDTILSNDDSTVEIRTVTRTGQNISPRGSHRKKADTILTPPVRLGPAQIAAAATVGAAVVVVSKQVEVGIVATGDELVPTGAPRRAGQIFESNGLMLSALMRQMDALPRDLGIVRDEPRALREKLAEALRSPVVLTAGGMSMGTLDLVPEVFASLGVRWVFHGVDMRPGKPVAYGRGPDGQHILGLPGNPASAFVCALLFLRPIIQGLHGFEATLPRCVRASLACDLKPAKDSRPAFIPSQAWSDPNVGLLVQPVVWGGSGDAFGLALANALLVRDDPTQPAPKGSVARVILFFAGEW